MNAASKVNSSLPPPTAQVAPLIIDKAAVVFLSPTKGAYSKAVEELKKKYSQDDLAEVASDTGYYEMTASDFVKKRNVPIIETNQEEILFKLKDGREIKIKNSISSINQEVYMFDGVKPPELVKDIATFNDGKEFDSYFGKPSKKSK
jgi:hypothetical protein